jgi:hypothetical protein
MSAYGYHEDEDERLRRLTKVGGAIFIAVVCLFLWAVVAMDYGDSVASGTYTFTHGEETSTLVLETNHTFRQTRRIGNVQEQAAGTWRRVGQGGISFSKEFLVVTGDEPEPDGTTFCDMHKFLGIFPSLRLRQYHVLWYGKESAGDSLVGIYKGDEPNVTATLALGADHSFTQEVVQNNVNKRAVGTWKQDSNGTVLFSKQFLKTSGEALSPYEKASSMDPRGSNLQIEISQSEHFAEPVFRKHLLF